MQKTVVNGIGTTRMQKTVVRRLEAIFADDPDLENTIRERQKTVRMQNAQREAGNRPEMKTKISERMKQVWAERRVAKKEPKEPKPLLTREERGAILSAAVRKVMENPEVRARVGAGMKKAWTNPELKEKHSVAMKAAWARRKAAKGLAVQLG